MNKIIIVDLPKKNKEVKGLWFNGYPIHKGHKKDSLNYATFYSNKHKIVPDQTKLKNEYKKFIGLVKSKFDTIIIPFPEELNKINNLHHDAMFIRDSGLMVKDKWIKARFSVKDRVIESDSHAEFIKNKFKKKIIELPKGAYLEFGEVFYLKTKEGSYYFGGLSRSNKKGHDFVRSILKPDNYCLIKSKGYHLDTVFSPVLDKNNKLIAFIIAKNMIDMNSIAKLKKFNTEIIYIDPIDSSGKGKELGNYAVNAIVGKGIIISCSKFLTNDVERKLKTIGVKHYTSPLTYFRYAGGSYHCLTNEIYD